MHKAWWVTQLDRKQLADQLVKVAVVDTNTLYRLPHVSEQLVSILIESSVFSVLDPRDQLQLSYDETPEPPLHRWTIKKVPLHVAKLLPIATYIDVGNNMLRVFEEVSEFTRRY